jgi:hypothetical protein
MDFDNKIKEVNAKRDMKMRQMMGDLGPAGDPDLLCTSLCATSEPTPDDWIEIPSQPMDFMLSNAPKRFVSPETYKKMTE